jgi:hypothetical protein
VPLGLVGHAAHEMRAQVEFRAPRRAVVHAAHVFGPSADAARRLTALPQCEPLTFAGPAADREQRTSAHPARLVDSRPMDRRLARQNIRTALIAGIIGVMMFGLTFLAAYLYTQ